MTYADIASAVLNQHREAAEGEGLVQVSNITLTANATDGKTYEVTGVWIGRRSVFARKWAVWVSPDDTVTIAETF